MDLFASLYDTDLWQKHYILTSILIWTTIFFWASTSLSLEKFIINLKACLLCHFIHVWLFVDLWTIACQAPLSMGFFWKGYWSHWSVKSSYHALLQGIFMIQGQNPHLIYYRQILYCWAIREAQSKGHPYCALLFVLYKTACSFFFSKLKILAILHQVSHLAPFFSIAFSHFVSLVNIFIILTTLQTFLSVYFYDDL